MYKRNECLLPFDWLAMKFGQRIRLEEAACLVDHRIDLADKFLDYKVEITFLLTVGNHTNNLAAGSETPSPFDSGQYFSSQRYSEYSHSG